MKFDKSKILTVVTADQAKVGQKGWVAVLPQYIQEIMSDGREPSVLSNIDLDSPSPFTMEGRYAWPLFYPVPEPTYAERQAEWIKENNVKEGTKVRVTRTFTENEDGSSCWEHDDLVGMTGSVDGYGIVPHSLGINMSDGNLRAIPYFALEVINEPTYAERQAEWVKENGVKEGTKVRFTKNFTNGEDGSGCCEHKYVKGMEGVVKHTDDDYLAVLIPYFGGWTVPFTALEVIKEPTYRPYNNDELNDLVGKVLIQKNTGNAMMAIKAVDGEVGKLISLGGSQKRNAQQLLDGWTHKNGEPCGVREEI